MKPRFSNVIEKDMCMATVKNYMDKHYKEPIQISDLAQLSGMSISVFYRQFKNYFGVTPLQYITNKKVDEAKKLLLSTPLKIYDISYTVGYTDSYYFSRIFKRTVGISPQQFKELAKGVDDRLST